MEYKSIYIPILPPYLQHINVLSKEKQFISLKRIIDDYYWEPLLPQVLEELL